jgi:hypothetical protein
MQANDNSYTYYYLNGFAYPSLQRDRKPGVIDMTMLPAGSHEYSVAKSVLIGYHSTHSSTANENHIITDTVVLGTGNTGGETGSVLIGHNSNISGSYGLFFLHNTGTSYQNRNGIILRSGNNLLKVEQSGSVALGDSSLEGSYAPKIGIGFGYDGSAVGYAPTLAMSAGHSLPILLVDSLNIAHLPMTELTDLLNSPTPLVAATKEYVDHKINALRVDTDITASDGQTTISLTYDPDRINVFRQGIKLRKNVDYQATDGSSITLTQACRADEWIQVVTW